MNEFKALVGVWLRAPLGKELSQIGSKLAFPGPRVQAYEVTTIGSGRMLTGRQLPFCFSRDRDHSLRALVPKKVIQRYIKRHRYAQQGRNGGKMLAIFNSLYH